jgi:PAS domain S-box-containing protein
MDSKLVTADLKVHLPEREPAAPHGPISDVENLESALRSAQANLLRYHELFEFAPDGYFVTNLQAIIQQANQAAAVLLGTRSEFLPGKPLLFFVSEGYRRTFADNLRFLIDKPDAPIQWELKVTPTKGPQIEVQVMAASNPTPELPRSIRWILRDITRRKRAEENLQIERDFLENLIDMAEAVILVAHPNGRIIRANPYLRTITGYDPEEMERRSIFEFLVPEDRQPVSWRLASLMAGLNRTHGNHRFLARDSRPRTLAWSARLLAGNSEPALILLVGNDITELHEAQQRALQAERLATIGQMSAGLAHESRNALQRSQACLAILGVRLAGQPEALNMVARIQKAQEDLQRIYEEVQSFAGPINLQVSPCQLDLVWHQAWEDLAHLRQSTSATLVLETAGMEPTCLGSAFHLRQVFRNLFENALSAAGEAPRVVVRCQAAKLDGRDAIEVAIQDNGPGFAEQDRQRAFEFFFTTKVRGTGLGLPICKRIVEAHGGRIAISDSSGPGALLLITLPR